MEKLYQDAIKREEERITFQHKMLLLYQKEIRNRKGKVLELIKESARRRNINMRENELENLMHDIDREVKTPYHCYNSFNRNYIFFQRGRSDVDMNYAEERIQENELKLLSQKYKEDELISGQDYELLNSKFQDKMTQLTKERENLYQDFKNVKHNFAQKI